MRSVKLTSDEAKDFFLKEECYCNFDLPNYFCFGNLLKIISKKIESKRLSDFYSQTEDGKANYPDYYDDVNYKFLYNKDGKYSWRPLQLIHPALYVSLVHIIAENNNWNLIVNSFKGFRANSNISCYSLPILSESKFSDKAITINQWWRSIEQKSIELALEYDFVLHTDISDCYGSIYTHTVPWALHTKLKSKKEKNESSLLGNIIDKILRAMSYGQTNGIPQGSVLMDFIAEIVLGYADTELTKKIEHTVIGEYKIIRYRDDYRIFSKNPQDAELIAKMLTEVLIDLGMRLNAQKTIVSSDVIHSAVKADKHYWMMAKRGTANIQEHLFLIHNLSLHHPNSGSLSKALDKFYNRVSAIEQYADLSALPLISIVVDIAYKNPRSYSICAAILSRLLQFINDEEERKKIINQVLNKFEKIPNTGHIKIWLQRITVKSDRLKEYNELLCTKVNDKSVNLWNSDWLNADLQKLISYEPIIDEEALKAMDMVIAGNEVQMFSVDYDVEIEEPSDY